LPETAPEGARYRAFISYSHADKAVADWLHRALETYRIPAKLVGATTRLGEVPRRLTPIFRDRDELSASHDLGGELTAALRESAFLLVICTPASARSQWVREEVLAFKRMHGEHRVLAVIAGGEPNATDTPGREAEECFPEPLRFTLGADGSLTDTPAHPIAADIREGKDGRGLGKLKLVAGLTGVKLDELVQREQQRRIRRLTSIAAASMVGMTLAGGLAIYANIQRQEAVRQRQIADRESAASRAASDFLIGAFRLTNPATEDPRTVTALSILTRSAEKVRTELAGQPDIESRLLTTVGNAYSNLGLRAEAQALLEDALPDLRRAGPQGARAMEQLASVYLAQGHLKRAMATVDAAEAQLGPSDAVLPETRAGLERDRARVLFARGDPKGGLMAVDHALALYRAAPNAPPVKIAYALQTRGLALSDDGQFAAADASLQQSLAQFRKAVGDEDLLTGKAWQALALNDLAAGRTGDAEAHIGKALAIERRVLSDDNPLLADDISTQGQVLLAQKRFDPAAASLGQAVAIYRKAYGKPHFQTGISLVYLALAESGQGRTAAALAHIAEAKTNYDIGYGKLHPNHGDLLVNRATILARARRRPEALRDCAAGLKILGETLGPTAAFTKTDAGICAKL
jgi:tetratricopeptide (TPR) repeat protein